MSKVNHIKNAKETMAMIREQNEKLAKEAVEEMVNHPSHYNFGKIEVIDAIEDWDLGFNKGNAVKYIARAGRKSDVTEVEDLKKAVWYLQREIKYLIG